jgi:hypothetical protein
VGQEQPRVSAALAHAPPEPLVHLDVHRLAAVRTRSRDLHFQAFVSEASFDEGRGKGILRSSAENPLPGAKSQAVWRSVSGHGKGPTHFAAGVPDQEKQMLLQILEQVHDNLGIQPERTRNLHGAQRRAVAGQFANYEISHRVVMRRHESQIIAHADDCTMVHR